VLYVGGGGFTLPRYFKETAGATATVLEVDPTIVEIAEERLALEPGAWLDVEVGDARLTAAEQPDDGFDVVVGDAFGGRSVPWHLTTVEFLSDLRDRLRADGIYVLNLIDHPPSRFARAELATLGAVFPHVAVIAPPSLLDGTAGGNFVLVGSDAPIDASAIRATIARRGGIERVLTDDAALTFADGARVLRDEYAPVDQLLSRP
jgi:spermidine synthase